MNSVFLILIGFLIAIALGMILIPALVPEIKNNAATKPKLSLQTIGIMLLVPIVAGLLYAKLGSPGATDLATPKTAAMMPSAMPSAAKHEMADLGGMAARLAKKLEQNPDNAEGWALLARSYVELKQHKEAVPAFEKAIALTPQDPQLLTDYVDARAVTQNRHLDEKAAELIDQALKLDPNHPKALMLSGTMAFDQKNYKKSIEIWEHLLASIKNTEEKDLQNEVLANIAEARHQLETSANASK